MFRSPFGAAKLESLDPPPKPDPNALPNADPPIALKPELLSEAKEDGPALAKALVAGPLPLELAICVVDEDIAPNGDITASEAGRCDGLLPEAVDLVPPVPKGEIVELARAANPEEANADEDVWLG